jgi:ribosomal-protein-alanine N-acetyltransferase
MRARHDPVSIRAGVPADLDAIDALERRAFTTPWSKEALRAEICAGEDRVCLIAEVAGEFAGYAMFWGVADEIHLVTIAVEPGMRRRGIASALLNSLLDSDLAHDKSLVTLEVRAGNSAAIELYRRYGFREVALRPRYYPDNHEDALVMLRELRPSAF